MERRHHGDDHWLGAGSVESITSEIHAHLQQLLRYYPCLKGWTSLPGLLFGCTQSRGVGTQAPLRGAIKSTQPAIAVAVACAELEPQPEEDAWALALAELEPQPEEDAWALALAEETPLPLEEAVAWAVEEACRQVWCGVVCVCV